MGLNYKSRLIFRKLEGGRPGNEASPPFKVYICMTTGWVKHCWGMFYYEEMPRFLVAMQT